METPKSKKNRSRLSLNGTANEIVTDSNLQRPNIDSNLMVGSSSSISNAQQHTNADHLKMGIVPYTGIGSVEVVWCSPSDRSKKNSPLSSSRMETTASDCDSPSHYYVPPKRRLIKQESSPVDYNSLELKIKALSTDINQNRNAREGTETDEQEAAQTDPQELQRTCIQHVMVMDRSPTESRKDKTSVDLSVRPNSCKRSLAGNNNFDAKTRHENISSFVDITSLPSDRNVPINASPATAVSEGVGVGNLTSYFEEEDDLMVEHMLRISQELEAKSDAPKAGTCKVSDTKSTRPSLGVSSSFRKPLAVSNQSSSASYNVRGTNSQVNKSSGDKVCLENKGTTNIFGIPNSSIQARDKPMYYLGQFRKPLTASEMGRNANVTSEHNTINQRSHLTDTTIVKRQFTTKDKGEQGSFMMITSNTAKSKGQCAQTTRNVATVHCSLNSYISSNTQSNTHVKTSNTMSSTINSKPQFKFDPQNIETSHSLASHIVTSKPSSGTISVAKTIPGNPSSFTVKTASRLSSNHAAKISVLENATTLNLNKSSIDCGNTLSPASRRTGYNTVPRKVSNNMNCAVSNNTEYMSRAEENKTVTLSKDFQFYDIDEDLLNNAMDETMGLLSQVHSNPVIMPLDKNSDSGLNEPASEKPHLSDKNSQGAMRKIGRKFDPPVMVRAPSYHPENHTSHSSKGHVQVNPNSGTITNKLSSSVPKGGMTRVLPSHGPPHKHLAVNYNGSHKGPFGVGSMSSEDHDATSDANFYHSKQFLEIWDSLESGTRTPSETNSDASQEMSQRRLEALRRRKASLQTKNRVPSTHSQWSSP